MARTEYEGVIVHRTTDNQFLRLRDASYSSGKVEEWTEDMALATVMSGYHALKRCGDKSNVQSVDVKVTTTVEPIIKEH